MPTIYPAVQCVHHFCSLRTSSVLAGFTSIFCFVFDTTNKWAGHFERSDFFWSSLPGMNHLNWFVIARIFIYIILIGCTVYYIHLFFFNFHVTIEHQPCNKPNLYTQYACFISAMKLYSIKIIIIINHFNLIRLLCINDQHPYLSSMINFRSRAPKLVLQTSQFKPTDLICIERSL